MRSRVNDVISATQRMAYTRRSNLQVSKRELRKKRNNVLILFLKPITVCFVPSAFNIHQRAEIRSGQKRIGSKLGGEGKIMNLSVETKVAIAVATSFVVLMMGAMAAQG